MTYGLEESSILAKLFFFTETNYCAHLLVVHVKRRLPPAQHPLFL